MITQADFVRLFPKLAVQFPRPEYIQSLLGIIESKPLLAGSVLIQHRQPCSAMYLVAEGLLDVAVEGRDGSRLAVGSVGPGEWVGEVTLLAPGPSTATVAAARDCRLLVLEHEALARLAGVQPEVAAALLKALSLQLAARLREHGDQVVERVSEASYRLSRPTENNKRAAISLLQRLLGLRETSE